jgi:hypothetical protein
MQDTDTYSQEVVALEMSKTIMALMERFENEKARDLRYTWAQLVIKCCVAICVDPPQACVDFCSEH